MNYININGKVMLRGGIIEIHYKNMEYYRREGGNDEKGSKIKL